MSASEKAISLLKDFWDATYKDGKVFSFDITYSDIKKEQQNLKRGTIPIERAKSCALLCVEEIIKVAPWISQEECDTMEQVRAYPYQFVKYWEQVKEELQKM